MYLFVADVVRGLHYFLASFISNESRAESLNSGISTSKQSLVDPN